MVFGHESNISHLKIFGCVVFIPIALPQCTNMGPQRRLGLYIGYEFLSIIKYLEPMTGDTFTTPVILIRQIEHTIKTTCLDNVGEFTSQTFNNCCMLVGKTVKYLVAQIYT